MQELQSQLVAKQAELDELKAGAMAAKDAEVHVQNDKAIQEAEIQAKTALASKDAELDAKMAELEAKNVELQTQAHTLKEQQGTIQELQRQLADATAKVEGSAGNAEDLRARDHKISQLELQINVLKMENADTSKEVSPRFECAFARVWLNICLEQHWLSWYSDSCVVQPFATLLTFCAMDVERARGTRFSTFLLVFNMRLV